MPRYLITQIEDYLPRLRALKGKDAAQRMADHDRDTRHVSMVYEIGLFAVDHEERYWQVYVSDVTPKFFRGATLEEALTRAEHAVANYDREPAASAPIPVICEVTHAEA